jgi:soluble lytic murein transglycosylase-like protein
MRVRRAAMAIFAATTVGAVPVAAQGSNTAPIPKAAAALSEAAKTRAARRVTDRYDDTFRKYSKRYFGINFDWHLFKAQGMAESGLSPTATSWVGARGIMQLMPSTYAVIQSARPEFKAIDDPEWNIAAGIMHDRYLWKLYTGDISDEERSRFMFASYNAGEGTIKRARAVADKSRLDHTRWSSIEQVAPTVGRWRYSETLGYVRKIEANLLTIGARK